MYNFFNRKKVIIFLLFSLIGLFIIRDIYKGKVQEKISTFFLQKIKNRFGDNISIKYVSFNFLKREFVLYDVKIKDHHYFHFIHLSKCKISFNNLFSLIFINSNNHLNLRSMIIENSSFFIKKYFKEKENNMLLFFRNILNIKTNKIKIITCSKLKINKSYFTYDDKNSNKKLNHFFSINVNNILIKNRRIKASIYSFRSMGFINNNKKFFIKKFSGDIEYFFSKKLTFRDCSIKTSNSFLKGNFFLFWETDNFPSKKSVKCKIFEGSKLGPDLGIFFFKKWNKNFVFSIQGSAKIEFNGIEKKLYLYDTLIKDLQNNNLSAKKIYIFLDKRHKKIQLHKSIVQFYPKKINQIIPYNFYSKFYFFNKNKYFKQWISNDKNKWIYKGDLIFIRKKNQKYKTLQINGYIRNHYLNNKISTIIKFSDNNIQCEGEGIILIKKNYLFKPDNKDKNSLSILFKKIIPKNLFLFHIWKIGNIEKKFLNLLKNKFFSHPECKIHFKGKINSNFQKVYLIINKNKDKNKEIKIMLTNNHQFKKININTYNMIISKIHGNFKWKDLFFIPKNIFVFKNEKKTKYIDFNFTIKKSFFYFLLDLEKKNKNVFSDIIISGKLFHNTLKTTFLTRKIQFNNKFLFDDLFVTISHSLMNLIKKTSVNINVKKFIYGNIFFKEINTFIFELKNFWIINSKFLSKLKGQEYKEKIFKFLHKIENNTFIFYPVLYKLNINGYDWNIINKNRLGTIKINFLKKRYTIDNMVFSSEKQKIIINADFIENNKRKIQLYFKNVQLKKFNNKNIDGLINGSLSYISTCNYKKIEPDIHIKITNLSIDNKILGDFHIHSFQKEKKCYEINGFFKNNHKEEIIKIYGNINNELKDHSKINININVKNLTMDNFSFWDKMNVKARGYLEGKVKIFGNANDLHYDGKIELKKFGIRVNSTHLDYEITNRSYLKISSESPYILLSPSSFRDTKSDTRGCINGYFLHKNFMEWNSQLFIKTNNLLFLDINEKQNHFLFGKIFAKGKIKITKEDKKINLSIKDGEILNSSHLYFNPREYKSNQKILDNSSSYKKDKENEDFLSIDIKTVINKNTKISIFIKDDLKNFFELNGGGSLSLIKKHNQNVEMNVKYFVFNGLVHLLFKKKISKLPLLNFQLKRHFLVEPGGVICWKKDLSKSTINLVAYKTMYVSKVNDYINNKNLKVDKNIIFTKLKLFVYGKIKKPNVDIEISFPKSDKKIQQKLLEKLNSFKEKKIQFISILFSKKFSTKRNIIYNYIIYFLLRNYLNFK
ncbi:translocation/assembly module TamB domain-containing protein [Blattabacterium cuenoti]|uniref:translocation/assembly module TamB domain-containing protein n=1 Tax=Blattabacterium cuenoti TaxID=1653831 RepID=UPI00163C66A5|nr:translocation/assembly module TamB domain-containing protein [Blattabacterium cuenoti]